MVEFCITLVLVLSAFFGCDGRAIESEPLCLTPYIEKDEIEFARRASAVKPLKGNVESYSGFFKVSIEHNSNLFFWFFPHANKSKEAPFIIWLNGGPGTSSLKGLFEENGPYYIKNGEIHLRNLSWTQFANVLYIDNPVGTGFSFTDDNQGYVTDQYMVGRDLLEAVSQFYLVFPEYQATELYIAGESYGGKFAPALAYALHLSNNKLKKNLQGIIIGNGVMDPISVEYSEFFYEIGLLDIETRKIFKLIEDSIKIDISNEEYLKAYLQYDKFFWGAITPPNMTYFYNVTGYTYLFNYLHPHDPNPVGEINKLLSDPNIKEAIHVGSLSFDANSAQTKKHLLQDIMKTVKPMYTTLVEHYRLMIYNGHLDLVIPYKSTEDFLSSLEWSGKDDFDDVKRRKWYAGNELAGYVKYSGNLASAMVYGAGHRAPIEQPFRVFDLVQKFTSHQQVNSSEIMTY